MPEFGKIRINHLKAVQIKGMRGVIKRVKNDTVKVSLSDHLLIELKAKGINDGELKYLAYKYSLPQNTDPANTAWEHLFKQPFVLMDVRSSLAIKGFFDPFYGTEKFDKIYQWVNGKIAGKQKDIEKVRAIVGVFTSEPQFSEQVLSALTSKNVDPFYKYLSVCFLFHLFAANQGLKSGIVFPKNPDLDMYGAHNWVEVDGRTCKIDLFDEKERSRMLGGNFLERQIPHDKRAIFGLPPLSFDGGMSTLTDKKATGSQIFAAWHVAEGNKLQRSNKLVEAERQYRFALEIDNTDTFNLLTALSILGSKILEARFDRDAVDVIRERMMLRLSNKDNLKFSRQMNLLSVRLAFRAIAMGIREKADKDLKDK